MNSTGNTTDLLQMLQNITDIFPSVFILMKVIFVLIGVILFSVSLLDLYALNNENAPRRAGKSVSPAGIVTRIFVSMVFVSLTWFVDVSQNTLYGADASGGLMVYQGSGLSATQKMALEGIFAAFALCGYVAFGRGWYLLDKHFNGGNNGVGASIAHIIAGTMLVYLDVWMPTLGKFIGFDFVNILLF